MDAAASRYIVNGAHETAKLAELLDSFIKKFVLCGSCQNPETVMVRIYSMKEPNPLKTLCIVGD